MTEAEATVGTRVRVGLTNKRDCVCGCDVGVIDHVGGYLDVRYNLNEPVRLFGIKLDSGCWVNEPASNLEAL